jgi:hypothetical protein
MSKKIDKVSDKVSDKDLDLSLGDLSLDDLGEMDLGEAVPDALAGVKETGDVEVDAAAELEAVRKAFLNRKEKASKDRLWAGLDSEYWFCVCFQSRDQKEAFLKAMKWFEHGDKYLDGKFVAKKLGVALPAVDLRFVNEKPLRSFVDTVGIIENRGESNEQTSRKTNSSKRRPKGRK